MIEFEDGCHSLSRISRKLLSFAEKEVDQRNIGMK